MQQQDNREYPFLYQRQTCHQVQPNQDRKSGSAGMPRSEERFSRNAETDLVCRLLLEKKKTNIGTGAADGVKNNVCDLAGDRLALEIHENLEAVNPTGVGLAIFAECVVVSTL